MFLDISGIKRWGHSAKLQRKQLILVGLLILILVVMNFNPMLTTDSDLSGSHPPQLESKKTFEDNGVVRTVKFNNTASRCRSPSKNPWNTDLVPFYSQPEAVNCPKLINPDSPFSGVAFAIKNGNQLHQLVDMGLNCCFQKFSRDTDEFLKYRGRCFEVRGEIMEIPKTMDYVRVLCRKEGQFRIVYHDAFPIVHWKKVAPSTNQLATRDPNLRQPLNVVIIGLDAASRLNFQRQMPLSLDYLISSMGAISMEGHSIVGEGSRANIVPMLTGLSLRYPLTYFNQSEFYKKCVSIHPNNFKNCPFIWNDFSKRGYITNFADDWTNFNEHWPNAFSNPPTDFYFRPYLLHMQKFAISQTPSHFCFGPRLAFQAVLDNMESVREVAEKLDRPHFQFTWTGRLAHDNFNTLGYGDVPLLRTLIKFKESGAWNDTVIMILADHGNAKTGYFDTSIGHLEYQRPVAYIVLPPWFHKMYSESYKNLVENSKGRMTTAFDIYETLQDFMDWAEPQNRSKVSDNSESRRGMSLFKAIPKNRGCLQAEISPKNCHSCHKPISLKNGDLLAKNVANFLVKIVNKLSDDDNRNNCMVQSLQQMRKAWKWDSRDIYQEFCDHHGKLAIGRHHGYFHRLPQNLSVSCDRVDIVNIKFETTPGGSIYHGEVIVIRHGNHQEMHLTDDIERLDRYSLTGSCVKEAVKGFCICKRRPVNLSQKPSAYKWYSYLIPLIIPRITVTVLIG